MRTTQPETTETTLYRYRCEVCGKHGRGLRDESRAQFAGARHVQQSHRRAIQRLLFNAWTVQVSTAKPRAHSPWTWLDAVRS